MTQLKHSKLQHNNDRRVFLKTAFIAGCSVYTLASHSRVYGAWPEEVFNANNLDSVLGDLAEGESALSSEKVVLTVPELVENPAIVPVSVAVELEKVESIAVLIESNERPLAGKFILGEGVEPQISTRVRLEGDSTIYALAKADGAYYINRADVRLKGFVCKPMKPTTPAKPNTPKTK